MSSEYRRPAVHSTVAASVAATVAILAALIAVPAPAKAADGFQYWGYYHLRDGEWQFATKGANAITPKDGAVEGYRFAISTVDQARPPRVETTFDEICGGTDAAAGQKRIGIVLDYGTADEAPQGRRLPESRPQGHCAVVPERFSTQQALESVADLRIQDGLICAIDGFPVTGCGEEVTDVEIPAQEPTLALQVADHADESSSAAGDGSAGDGAAAATGGSVPWSLVAVAVVLVVLAAAAVLLARRRRA
ncbi:MAG: SCO2322 family protein [Actinomycetota bacterium]|nr:SCO2322 family protein [Actinomycetota bacterium]